MGDPAIEASAPRSRIVVRMEALSDANPMSRLWGEILPDDPALRPWCARYARAHMARIESDFAIVQRARPEGRLLDVGAVPPFLMALLSDAGRDVVGVDVDPSRFGSCIGARGLDVRRCDVEREPLPFEDGTFDGVILSEVFEHLRIDLVFTMSELARVLRPGGRLMLTTPNMRSGRGIVSLALRGRSAFLCPDLFAEYGKLRTIGHMGHVREYTARDVTDLAARVGLVHVSTVWRRSARESLAERLLCTIAPPMRPYMTIILQRGGSMGAQMSTGPDTERAIP